MMKKIMVTIAVMAMAGGLYAQQNDTIASTKADTVSSKQTMELQEVGVSASNTVSPFSMSFCVFQIRVILKKEAAV